MNGYVKMLVFMAVVLLVVPMVREPLNVPNYKQQNLGYFPQNKY